MRSVDAVNAIFKKEMNMVTISNTIIMATTNTGL